MATLYRTTSRVLHGRIAMEVINDYGDEVLKV